MRVTLVLLPGLLHSVDYRNLHTAPELVKVEPAGIPG